MCLCSRLSSRRADTAPHRRRDHAQCVTSSVSVEAASAHAAAVVALALICVRALACHVTRGAGVGGVLCYCCGARARAAATSSSSFARRDRGPTAARTRHPSLLLHLAGDAAAWHTRRRAVA